MKSEWQKMETAPKDGTKILIWDGRDVMAGYYDVGSREWVGMLYQDFTISPTLWQPFPKKPEGE